MQLANPLQNGPLQGLPLKQAPRALPQQRGLALERPGWPLPLNAPTKTDANNAARGFETMILEQLLATARNAKLGGELSPLTGDTPLSAGQDIIHQQIDRTRAALIARAAPLGVNRLLKEAEK